MIRCAICDDEEVISEYMSVLTDNLFKDNQLMVEVKTYSDSREMYFDIYEDVRFDIALLDVEMPNYNGMQIAKLLKEKQPECLIIFLTSHTKYAVDAIELEVFRYIPKDDLAHRFEKYLMEAVEQIRELDERSYFTYKKGVAEKIPYKNIRYLRKIGKYTSMYCTDNHEVKIRKSIASVMEELDSSDFIYIDQGCAVNICYISKMYNRDVYLKNGERLPVSRSNVRAVQEIIMKYWSEKY